MESPDIQDWSILDSFISKNVEDFKKNVFGDLDPNTGYYDDYSEDEDQAGTEQPQEQAEAQEPQTDQQDDQDYEQEQQSNRQLDDEFMNILFGDVINNGVSDGEDDGVNMDYGSGSIAETHNNPGNLKYADWMKDFGAVPGKPGRDGGRFAHFNDPSQGLAARERLLKKPLYANKTVNEAMKLYSNNGYDGSIYPEIKDKKVSQLSAEELSELSKRQFKHEDAPYAKKLGFRAGGVARSHHQQYEGLNNPDFDELYFPLQGINTIRGLDSGEPVIVVDHKGRHNVLYGPEDTININGPVHEKRGRKFRKK